MKTLVLTTLFLSFPALALAQSSRAPQLKLKDLKGREFRLSDYRGKVVLLNFWATWCPPCRAEIPELIEKQKMYGPQGLQILGITYPPQKTSEVRSFVHKLRLNYPIALGTKATKSLFTSSDALPVTVVIDRDGLIRDVIEGLMYEDEFDQKIKPLLTPHDEHRDAHLATIKKLFQSVTAIRELSNGYAFELPNESDLLGWRLSSSPWNVYAVHSLDSVSK